MEDAVSRAMNSNEPVDEAFHKLTVQQRDTAWEELRKIRELIRADPNESTYDEVVRLLCPGAGCGRLKDGVPEHPRDSTDEDVERVYNDFWLPIFTEEMADGEHVGIMPMAVKRELYDYSILLEHVPKVYMEVTGGRVSKPNTVAAAVIGEYEDALNETCDQAVEDFKEEQGLGETKELAVEWLTASALLKDLGSLIPVQFQEAHRAFDILEPICKKVDEDRARERARMGVAACAYERKDSPIPCPDADEISFGEVVDAEIVRRAAVEAGIDEAPLREIFRAEPCLREFIINQAAALVASERARKGEGIVVPRVESITENHVVHQPDPIKGREEVLPEVLRDFQERGKMGLRKYGTPLMTHNGRNALVDLYQELQDACLYIKQRLMEEAGRSEGR